MATKTINQLTVTTGAVATDEVELQLAGGGASRKSTLANLQTAVMGQTWNVAPYYASGTYDGSDGRSGAFHHTTYQFKVGPAGIGLGGGKDEAIGIGYNVGDIDNTEPGALINNEIDWGATARGVASQRTLEAYLQHAAPANTGRTIAPRGWFWSFEPGDTSRTGVNAEYIGQYLYGYLSTGFNRAEAYPGSNWGGGALSIWNDAGQTGQRIFATFGTDGSKINKLRCVQAIAVINSATTGANMVLTVGVGNTAFAAPGATIQIFKTDANKKGWNGEWNTGARVTGVVTAVNAGAGTITTNITNGFSPAIGDNTSFLWGTHYAEVDQSYGSTSNYSPIFQNAAFGTSHALSVAFTNSVVGSVGCVGTFNLTHPGFIAVVNTSVNINDFRNGILNFSYIDPATDAANAKYQLITFRNILSTVSFGMPASAGGYEFGWLGFGQRQATDSNFIKANLSLSFYHDNNVAHNVVAIGDPFSDGVVLGYPMFAIGSSGVNTRTQVYWAQSTGKVTPSKGDMEWDGTNLKFCKVDGSWTNIV